jgi:hypothetical protein
MKKRNAEKPMLLTLCGVCTVQFYDSSEYIVRRVDKNQTVKESCCYCSCRSGWDYAVKRRVTR